MNSFSYTGVQLHQLQHFQQPQLPEGCHNLQYCQPQLAPEVAIGLQFPQGGSVVPQQKDKNNNKTGYRGVRQRVWGMFAAEIRDGAANKRRWVGTYPSSELAAKAYDAAALVLHGVKAKTNFAYTPSTVEMYKVPKGDAAAAEALLADIAAGRNLPVPEGEHQKRRSTADADSPCATRQEPAAAAAAAAVPANAHCYDVSWHSHSRSSSQEGYTPRSHAGTPSSGMQQPTVFGASTDSPMAAAGLAQLLLHPDARWMLQMHTAAVLSASTTAAAAVAGQSCHAHASAIGQAGVESGSVHSLHTYYGAGGAAAAAAGGSDKAVAACNMKAHECCANVSSPILRCNSNSMALQGDAGKHAQGGQVQLAMGPAAAGRDLCNGAPHSINRGSAEGRLDAQECDAAEAAALPRLVGSSGLSIQQAALAARLRASGSCDLMAPGMPQLSSVAATAPDFTSSCMEVSPAGMRPLPQLVLQEQVQQQCEAVPADYTQLQQQPPQLDAAPLSANQAVAATALLGSLLKLDFQQRSRLLEGLTSTGLFAAKKGTRSDMHIPGQPRRIAAGAQVDAACAQQQLAAAVGDLLQQTAAGYASCTAAAGKLGTVADAAMQGEDYVQRAAKRDRAGRESGGSEDSSGANGRAELPSAKRMRQLGACRTEAAAAAGERGEAGLPGAELASQMALQALADMAVMFGAGDANL